MKISEAPMLQTLLCKHRGATYSSIFEITKFALSDGLVYVRVISGFPGLNQACHHYWADLAELDLRWKVSSVR